MSKSAQPYKLGNGGSVGGTVAKAGAEIGTAISSGIEAVTGVKKHRASLEHIASENALDRDHEVHVIGLNHEHEAKMHQLDTTRQLDLVSAVGSLGKEHHALNQNVEVETSNKGVKFKTTGGVEPFAPIKDSSPAPVSRPTSAEKMRSFTETKKARGIGGNQPWAGKSTRSSGQLRRITRAAAAAKSETATKNQAAAAAAEKAAKPAKPAKPATPKKSAAPKKSATPKKAK